MTDWQDPSRLTRLHRDYLDRQAAIDKLQNCYDDAAVETAYDQALREANERVFEVTHRQVIDHIQRGNANAAYILTRFLAKLAQNLS
jgi:predicted metal-dependent phosphoesterase TrpH